MLLFVRILEGTIRRASGFLLMLSVKPFKSAEQGLVRYSMYGHLRLVLSEREEAKEILTVSGSWYLGTFINPTANFTDVYYPEVSLLDLPYKDNSFDCVVTDQVLEHVGGDPFKAMEECQRVLKPGGLAIHTSCLMMPIHSYPGDFWRFTPEGWKLLCDKYEEIIDVGGWGNRYFWLLSWLGLQDIRIPEVKWHPINRAAVFNEDTYPITTWVVARK